MEMVRQPKELFKSLLINDHVFTNNSLNLLRKQIAVTRRSPTIYGELLILFAVFIMKRKILREWAKMGLNMP